MANDAQDKVKALLQGFSVDEIASLLAGADVWHTVSIPKKGVKSMRLSDGPNGVRGIKTFNGSHTTAFPCPSAQGATWNKDLMHSVGEQMSAQAKAKGVSVILAPTVNLHRSPLGGRSFECFSEDPVLTGHLGASLIKGIQGKGTGACVKHFVCNDQETDRMKVDTIVDERTLREIYLKPFQIIIRDSNPWTLMSAYNKVNGTHASENKLLDDVLRKEWAWDGLIMSDWFGVNSSAEALNAGLDLEMPGPSPWRSPRQIVSIIQAGKVTFPTILSRASKVLALMLKASVAGIEERTEEREDNSQESRHINRKMAQEAIVLLKNTNGLLPLKAPSKIAIIGPNATRDVSTGGGSASIHQYYYVSAFEGLKIAALRASPDAQVSLSQGCFAHEMLPLLKTRTTSDKPGLDLEFFVGNFDQPGDILYTTSSEQAQMVFFDSLPEVVSYPAHARVMGSFQPEATGTYTFSLITTGRARLYVDGKLAVESWQKQERSTKYFGLAAKEVKGSVALDGSKASQILVEYSSQSSFTDHKESIFGAGVLRLGCIFEEDADEVMENAVAAAKDADVAILCIGTDQERESEGFDRADMRLVGRQNELVEKVLAANQNTVILNFSGTPIEMPWMEKASAIVQAWFLGSELGNAVADVVFGNYSPSGRLPVTFPLKLQDTPCYDNYPGKDASVTYAERLNIGYRHYTTNAVRVAFPFGHGLSYTSFEHTNLTSDNWDMKADGSVKISVHVENTGSVTGGNVVQLYVAPINSSVYRPHRELQGFAKVTDLAPQAKSEVTFILDKYSLSYYNEKEKNWVLEKGSYKVEIGTSSENIVLEHNLEVAETHHWTGV